MCMVNRFPNVVIVNLFYSSIYLCSYFGFLSNAHISKSFLNCVGPQNAEKITNFQKLLAAVISQQCVNTIAKVIFKGFYYGHKMIGNWFLLLIWNVI